MGMASIGEGRSIIELRDIGKTFATEEVETHALNGVHLDVHTGDYLCIAGPSGCGKTTLLSILGLLELPTRGEYTLAHRSVVGLGPAERAYIRRREIGFVFQAFNLISDLTVFENVELPLTYRSMHEDERTRRVRDALQRVSLSSRQHHYPAQLSGGQQQRVAVARAIAGDPVILLADEPTGNLDSRNADTVMTLLSELHRDGATICMVTHDMRYAARATRVIELLDGRVSGG